ncbi:MAG TPA: hypothetical protein VJK72_04250, partial [Candidatus Nanoarchaeia archaeon]|nr:hypothetical protein [Candidatus Nanoarchaeia archaeon]
NELKSVKAKMEQLDREVHELRADFEDTHLSTEEKKLLIDTLDDEAKGKTVSLSQMRKRLDIENALY